MSCYTKDHLDRALTWLEQNAPRGVQLVARALSETVEPNETFQEKWRRMGLEVEFSDTEPRVYEVREIHDGKIETIPIVRLPTVQDVDRWATDYCKKGNGA
jgi:hypothetical protein